MQRRDFIRLSLAGAAVLMMPTRILASQEHTASIPPILILIELEGGNDGLNTVVPYSDERYTALRPSLAIDASQVLEIDNAIGLHPALSGLHERWQEGTLAIVEGVGYPQPNRSHFRSKDIWNTASNSDEYLSDGWAGNALGTRQNPGPFADSVTMANDDTAPFAHPQMRNIVLRSAESYLNAAGMIAPVPNAEDNDALAHITAVQNVIVDSYDYLETAMRSNSAVPHAFGPGVLDQKCSSLIELLANGVYVPAFKLSHGSYDTHSNQASTHESLLSELDGALAILVQNLKALGLWQQTVIMTYSEFGRRAAENGSAGTDHGTAAVQFVLGGSVNGGLYGQRPSLSHLDENGDLVHTTDFRSMYRTVIEKWWQIPTEYLSEFETLGFL